MGISKKALQAVVKQFIAELPLLSSNGLVTKGDSKGGLGVRQQTPRGFLDFYPLAPICLPRENVEKKSGARSKTEAIHIVATVHITMVVYVHEVASRAELAALEQIQPST